MRRIIYALSIILITLFSSACTLVNTKNENSKQPVQNQKTSDNDQNINMEANETVDLGNNYFTDNNFVYHKYPKTGGFYLAKIEKADPKTFKIINETFSKDANFVFYATSVLEGADPYSFMFIDNGYINDANIYQYYAKDKNNVYAFRRYTGDKWIINGADPATFTLLDKYIYQKDKNFAYYEGRLLESSSANSFEIINPPDGTIITENTNLFQVPGPRIARDENSIWFYNKLIKTSDIDIKSFEIIDCWYQKDKNNVYIYNKVPGSSDFGEKIINADPNTFRFLDCHYAKDKNYVYYEGNIVPNADPNTITFVENNYSKKTGPSTDQIVDKNNTPIVEKINEYEYDQINKLFYYTKDKNSVYYKGEIVPNADPNTFKIE